jgi:hypothetical protein
VKEKHVNVQNIVLNVHKVMGLVLKVNNYQELKNGHIYWLRRRRNLRQFSDNLLDFKHKY